MCKPRASELRVEMKMEDSVCVRELPRGTRVKLQTVNRGYLIETCGGAEILLQGHPYYCPYPVRLYLIGSRRRGSAPESGTIRRGMPAEFWDPGRGIVLTTSRVRGFQMLPLEAER
jgi:hypothetical protein